MTLLSGPTPSARGEAEGAWMILTCGAGSPGRREGREGNGPLARSWAEREGENREAGWAFSGQKQVGRVLFVLFSFPSFLSIAIFKIIFKSF